jgi:hypothetical protein
MIAFEYLPIKIIKNIIQRWNDLPWKRQNLPGKVADIE